jgi:hypothetical protein
MSTQEKKTSICHIVSQNKIMTMENLAKLREWTVQTQVAKKLEYKEFKTIDHLLNLKWRFYDIEGTVFTWDGIRVQLVDEDVIGLWPFAIAGFL